MSQGTTLLFGLSGVRVRRVELTGCGGRVVHVETAEDAGAQGCPSCGVVATSVKGYVTSAPRDIPYGEGDLAVVWHKRRWRCGEAGCARKTFTEAIVEIPARARTTGRLRRAIASAVGDSCRSVAEVADCFGVSWPTAHKAVVAAADAAAAEPEPTAVLGIDETRRGRQRWRFSVEEVTWVRVDPWDTGFVDLAGAQGLFGQVEGRRSVDVVDWLLARTAQFREAIRFVAIDPAAPYAHAVLSVKADGERLLPNAVVVVDHFHLIKLANEAVTKVRRRVVWDSHGRRGRATDPAWANRRKLLCARERLSDKAFTKMWNAVIDGDPTGQILVAWIAKEELRSLCALAGTDPHRDEIRTRLDRFYRWCADSDLAELHTLATTIETWWPGTEAFLLTGITNAKTEGVNRLIKQVKRSACGFRNTTNSRRRIRFHCTRTQRAAAAASRTLPAQS